jgi:hypothetical protein
MYNFQVILILLQIVTNQLSKLMFLIFNLFIIYKVLINLNLMLATLIALLTLIIN